MKNRNLWHASFGWFPFSFSLVRIIALIWQGRLQTSNSFTDGVGWLGTKVTGLIWSESEKPIPSTVVNNN